MLDTLSFTEKLFLIAGLRRPRRCPDAKKDQSKINRKAAHGFET
jgi:hypothetical protein